MTSECGFFSMEHFDCFSMEESTMVVELLLHSNLLCAEASIENSMSTATGESLFPDSLFDWQLEPNERDLQFVTIKLSFSSLSRNTG